MKGSPSSFQKFIWRALSVLPSCLSTTSVVENSSCRFLKIKVYICKVKLGNQRYRPWSPFLLRDYIVHLSLGKEVLPNSSKICFWSLSSDRAFSQKLAFLHQCLSLSPYPHIPCPHFWPFLFPLSVQVLSWLTPSQVSKCQQFGILPMFAFCLAYSINHPQLCIPLLLSWHLRNTVCYFIFLSHYSSSPSVRIFLTHEPGTKNTHQWKVLPKILSEWVIQLVPDQKKCGGSEINPFEMNEQICLKPDFIRHSKCTTVGYKVTGSSWHSVSGGMTPCHSSGTDIFPQMSQVQPVSSFTAQAHCSPCFLFKISS